MVFFIPLNSRPVKFLFLSLSVTFFSTLPESCVAQFFFGRNKVQYNQFDWRMMRTEHFDIYFYPEMEELASIGAGYAEEAYKTLRAKFDHEINRRVPLIFYSSHFHFQETNVVPNMLPEGVGGFFEFIKGRVVIPANGSLFQFRHVIFHELVHVFSRNKFGRVMKDGRKTDWTGLPLWFTEGLAEYWSIKWDSRTEMVIRDAVINNFFFPLEQIYQIHGTYLMYKEGQAFFRFIAENYGENKIIQIFENYWKNNRFSQVMKATFGKELKELDEEWLYSLKKRYYPILESKDLPGRVTAGITKEGVNSKPAFFRLNHEPYVAFYSNRTGYSNIYLKRLDRDDIGESEPEIAIKGERSSEFESFHLLQSKLDASNDGRLAFISKSEGRDAIYVYDLKKREILHRLQFDDLVYLSSPAISPNGNRIVFAAIHFSGQNDLFVANLKEQSLVRLTNDLFDDRDPCWAPTGDAVVFSSDRTDFGLDGAYNLFQLDLATLAIEHVTNGNFIDSSPVWSDDGKYLAFSSDRDGATNLWVIRAGLRHKSTPTQLAGVNGNNGDQSVSLMQTEKYITTIEDALSPELVVEPVQLKKISHFVTGAFDPEWSDDGRLIFTAFENHNFHLRVLSDVGDLFDREQEIVRDQIAHKRDFWIKKNRYDMASVERLKYKKKFSLDIAQSFVIQDPTFGNYGGAQLAMSDILGNHQYYFLIYNDATRRDEFLKNLNVAVTRVDLSRRFNFAYGGYHFAGRFYNLYDGFFYERRYGGFFSVSYPISIFRRIETNLNLRNSEREWFSSGRLRKALLVSNFVSLVKDNSLWGRTGPVDGERYNITLGNTVDVQRSNVNFYTLIADYRRYFRLGNRVTLATRSMGSFNVGKETIKFFMGGSWDLRGYDRWTIWGENMILFSQELRFPLIDGFAVKFPFGGLGFSTIRGALFLDNGNAWNGPFQTMLGSYGIGARLNLIGFLVLRLDYGKTFHTDFDGSLFKPKRFQVDRGTFTQFFFGFDF